MGALQMFSSIITLGLDLSTPPTFGSLPSRIASTTCSASGVSAAAG